MRTAFPLFKRLVFLFLHRFKPFIMAIDSRHLEGKVGEPFVLACPMPMFDSRGDVDDIARMEFPGWLSPFLVIALPIGHEQYLPPAFLGSMDVPVVSAPRLEGDVGNEDPVLIKRIKIALPVEILGKPVIRLSKTKHWFEAGLVFGIGFPDQGEDGPGVGPADVEGGVSNDLDHLDLADPMLLGVLNMVFERVIGDPFG